MEKPLKICLAASLGGHLSELMELKKFYKKHTYFFITEEAEMTRGLAQKEPVYLIRLLNRRMWNFIPLFVVNIIKTYKIIKKENPDLVISTGALNSVPSCLLAKLLGKKLIFIESFAKIQTPTLSGRIVYPFADLFIVQWEPLLKYYPKAYHGGSIY